MEKISNSEELTMFYGKINKFIDDYIDNYHISPKEIHLYITKNIDRFLAKYNLTKIEGIKTIVRDVLEHRKNMEKDKVFKFSQFSVNINESNINFGSSTIEHEKNLADFYNTSVGHVQSINSEFHLFQVKSFDETIKCCVFSESEIVNLKKEFENQVLSNLYRKPITVDSINGHILDIPYVIMISDLIDKSEVKPISFDENSTLNNIGGYLIQNINDYLGDELMFNDTSPEYHRGYFIWEIRR